MDFCDQTDASEVTTIDLIRHGKLITPGLFCAHPDEPLSQEGLLDLFKATDAGHWDIIISSPYWRCREFAEILSEKRQCKLRFDDRFMEMDFGDWTGMTTNMLWQQEPERFQRLWQDPDSFFAPGGESMREFVSRVDLGLKSILDEHKNDSILLVTHAGVMRVILAKALDITHQSALRFTLGYARLTRLHYYPDGVYSLCSHGLWNAE